jgi:hypothetical protein
MTPTLFGRIQTRIFVTIVIGGIWTAIISFFLPNTEGLAIGDVYKITFRVVAAMLVLGLVWELVYHALMQYRWEKDWPSFFGFVTAINEGLLLWIVIRADAVPDVPKDLPGSTYLVHFVTVWIVTWLWLQGPMKILTPRWRFRGGRLV